MTAFGQTRGEWFGRKKSRLQFLPVVIPFRFCRVGLIKSLRRFFIPLLLVGWLVAISPATLALFPGLLAPAAADSAQTAIPTDNDDHSDDTAAGDDCTLQNRRIALPVLVARMLRLEPATFHPPARRQTPAFALPHCWHFAQRAVAPPRAPSFLA